MLEGGNAWNEELIKDQSINLDAKCILSIPLWNARAEDTLFWHYEAK